jgi:hypothetical protein
VEKKKKVWLGTRITPETRTRIDRYAADRKQTLTVAIEDLLLAGLEAAENDKEGS